MRLEDLNICDHHRGFELAGLGKAPHILLDTRGVGFCAICFKAVTKGCVIKSFDGQKFLVGINCFKTRYSSDYPLKKSEI